MRISTNVLKVVSSVQTQPGTFQYWVLLALQIRQMVLLSSKARLCNLISRWRSSSKPWWKLKGQWQQSFLQALLLLLLLLPQLSNSDTFTFLYFGSWPVCSTIACKRCRKRRRENKASKFVYAVHTSVHVTPE